MNEDSYTNNFNKIDKISAINDLALEEEYISSSNLIYKAIENLTLFPPNFQTELEKLFHIKIANINLYKQSFLHRSIIPYLKKNKTYPIKESLLCNERLEFIGDSVVNFVISEYLYKKYFDSSEGFLSNTRAKFINRQILGEVALKLKINRFLQISSNMKRIINDGNITIISNTLEAIIGAIFLDSNFQTAHKVVYEIILPILIELHPQEHLNYKSILMEQLQALGYNFPTYKVFATIGPVHNIVFFVGVYIENKLYATAYASTKKEAEQLAAKKAIELFKI